MNECLGILGWICGHKYEARFDEALPKAERIEGSLAILTAMKNRTYRGDVCRRCGDVVNQPEKP